MRLSCTMRQKWTLKSAPDQSKVEELVREIGIPSSLAGILVQRGVMSFDESKSYFNPTLEDLHDPFLMKGMDLAVARLIEAIAEGERIMVYGDYDVDGSCSVSLVYGFLKQHTDNIEFYIPDRYGEGYGVSNKGIESAIASGVKLLITLDCGIKAVGQIEKAQQAGIDTIVCDHHLPGRVLPPAVAILDPKQEGCDYPFKELCGCGVGFKLLSGFCLEQIGDISPIIPFLDFVAIATCADIVPMMDENRTLVHAGMQVIEQGARPGIQALLKVASMTFPLTVMSVVFGFAPRINAAGRMDHAKGAVDLLLSDNAIEAEQCARAVDQHNKERRTEDHGITEEVLEKIKGSPSLISRKSTVLYNENWHKGVIGIVASRVMEHYYRPTIIMTKSNGHWAGSARSVQGFDVHEAIESCSDLLEQFGGHKYAAGLTIEEKNLDPFVAKFEEVVCEKIEDDQLVPEIEIDLDLDLDIIDPKFYRILRRMGPYGPLNMQPVFRTRNVYDSGSSKVLKEKHLKLSVQQQGGSPVAAIAFGMGNMYEFIKDGQPFDIVYTIEENVWRDQRTIQLHVKDIHCD